MTHKFKVGDVVKRVSNISNAILHCREHPQAYQGKIVEVSSIGGVNFGHRAYWSYEHYELVEKEEPKEYVVTMKDNGDYMFLGDHTKMTLEEAEEFAKRNDSRGPRVIYRVQPIASFTPNTEVVRKDLT